MATAVRERPLSPLGVPSTFVRIYQDFDRGFGGDTALMPIDHHRETNRANWDARVPIHLGSDIYGIERFLDDPEFVGEVVRFDAAKLGRVDGRRLLHLQCHIGTDTIGWARLGTEATGIDISPKSIEAARSISEDTGTVARFIVSDLYDAPAALPETFDIVYTGVGAICWLPDIKGWADVVAGFLEPGGHFYMREGHPFLWALDIDRDDDLLVVDYPYFETAEPQHWSEDFTYAGDGEVVSPDSYEWNHGMARDPSGIDQRRASNRRSRGVPIPRMGGRTGQPARRRRSLPPVRTQGASSPDVVGSRNEDLGRTR